MYLSLSSTSDPPTIFLFIVSSSIYFLLSFFEFEVSSLSLLFTRNKDTYFNHSRIVSVRREINILRLLSHPHVVRLFEVIETPTTIYMVMEYMDSGELFDHITEHGRLHEAEARYFFQQVLASYFINSDIFCSPSLLPSYTIYDFLVMYSYLILSPCSC